MLDKLICYFRGHLRGKRVKEITGSMARQLAPWPDEIVFRCPRCDATWKRKAAKVK